MSRRRFDPRADEDRTSPPPMTRTPTNTTSSRSVLYLFLCTPARYRPVFFLLVTPECTSGTNVRTGIALGRGKDTTHPRSSLGPPCAKSLVLGPPPSLSFLALPLFDGKLEPGVAFSLRPSCPELPPNTLTYSSVRSCPFNLPVSSGIVADAKLHLRDPG